MPHKTKKMAEKEVEEKKDKKSDNNMKRIVIMLFIIVFLLALALALVIFKEPLLGIWHNINGDVFTYHNMTYVKGNVGSITMYATQLAIYRPVENQTFSYTLYLRNDPRVLDKIPANITEKLQRPSVYVSFEREPLVCNYTSLAAYKLGEFIDALGLYKEGAFATLELANESGYGKDKVKNCSDAKKGESVILFKKSDNDESYIHQDGYCYVLEVANCETLETSERLVLSLMDTMH